MPLCADSSLISILYGSVEYTMMQAAAAAKGHPKCDGELSCAAAHYHRQSRIHFDKSFNYILHHSTISAVCAMMCSIIFLNNFLNLVREMCFFSSGGGPWQY